MTNRSEATPPTVAEIRTRSDTIMAFLQNPQPTDLDQCKAELAHALSHLGRSLEIEAELLAENDRLRKALEEIASVTRLTATGDHTHCVQAIGLVGRLARLALSGADNA